MVISWLTFAFCSIFFVWSLKRVIEGSFSLLHLASLAFYIMQVVPLLVECLFGFDDSMHFVVNMYYASLDNEVHLFYCGFCCLTMMIFCVAGRFFSPKKTLASIFSVSYFDVNPFVFFLLLLGIFSPLVTVAFAPDPSIYLVFARFYSLAIGSFDVTYLYHLAVVTHANYIAFLCLVLLYFFNDKKIFGYNLIVFLGIVICTWIDGKRTLFTFALLMILAIDIIRNRYVNDRNILTIKSMCFCVISVVFFLIYKEYSGKNADSDFLVQYNQYYSRMASVKTSIYAFLYDKPIVEYKGQTILFDLFFFLPRNIWPDKPVLFVKYFTAFALNRKWLDFSTWNLIVNIWCEFFGNFGALGYLGALGVVGFVAKVVDSAKNALLRLWGTLFIILYFLFGFELMVLIVYVLFVVSLIFHKIKDRVQI